MPTRSTRAPYLGPANRRGPVLDAALACFADGGFEAASMSAIAQRAGVAKPVLYACFPGGKQELWFALLDREEQSFSDHIATVLRRASNRGLEQGLTEGLTAFLDYADVAPLGFRVIFGPAGTAVPDMARRSEEVRERIVSWMMSGLAAAHGPGALADVAELYVRAVVAVAEDLARWSVRRPDLDRTAMVQLLVLWFMQGFERLIPAAKRRQRS